MRTYTPEEVFNYIQQVEELTNPFIQNSEKDIKRMTLTGALAEVGIPHSTYRDWLKEPIYFEYLRDEQLMKSYMSNHESKAILMDAIN